MDDKLTLLPDLTAPPKIRQKRAPKHDFHDGQGSVFAHHHDNGGGWVADTAYVAPTVKVARHAAVYNFAKVYNNCKIEGRSCIYGRARLYDDVHVTGASRISGNSVVAGKTAISGRVYINGHVNVSGCATSDGPSSTQTIISGQIDITGQATLINVTARNEKTNVWQYISGAPVLKDTAILNFARVSGAAVILGGSIDCVSVLGNAVIRNSALNTFLPNEVRAAVYGKTETDKRNGELLSSSAVVQILGGTILFSTLTLSPLVVTENCRVFNAQLWLSHPVPTPPRIQDAFHPGTGDRVVVADVHATNWDRFLEHQRASAQPAASHAALPAIPQIGAAPVLATGSGGQRRILRLE